MKQCGKCSLCCKVLRFEELDKPAGALCEYCVLGRGCKIYQDRPKACRDYQCLWLKSPDMPDRMRPDLVDLFVEHTEEMMVVRVDPDLPDAWKEGSGREVVDSLVEGGNHVLVAAGMQLTFLPGRDRPVPNKIVVDWLL